MIRAGRSELATHLAPAIEYRLRDLPDLRNFMAHPENLDSLEKYDWYARIAERLMARLGDVPRLAELVAARDALREEAVKFVVGVEERATLAQLQGAYVEGADLWESAHINFFWDLLDQPGWCRDGLRATHPVAVGAAERYWEVNALCALEDRYPW